MPIQYKQIPVLVILLVTGLSNLFSQQVTYDWKHVIPGNTYTALCCMATDSSGYVYVGGRLDSSVSFVDTTVTNTEPTGFIAKFDTTGNMIWFKQFEYSATVYSMCFDSEDNFYISGMYRGKVRINDTLLYTWDVDTTYFGMFLAKFDTDGNRIWAKTTAGSFYYESGFAKLKQMTIDKDDNLVLISYAINEIEFFDTTATYTKTIDSLWVTTPYPHWEYFYDKTNVLVKFNKHGQKLWLKDVGMHQQHYLAIATDYSNNILLTGYFWDDYPFVIDSVTLNASGGENIFIIKYNPDGNLLWAQRGGSLANINKGYDIISDSSDNIYLSGQISGGSVEFGGVVYPHSCYRNAFLTKYNEYGLVQWVNFIPNQVYYYNGNNIAIELEIINDFIYVSGFFRDSILLGFTDLISMSNHSGIFIKFSSDGIIQDASMDMESNNTVYPIDISFSNNVFFVAGNKAYYSTYWKWDMFFGIFIENFLTEVQIVINKNQIDCILYPNPCQDIINIDFYNLSNRVINIYNINGKLLSTYNQNGDRHEIDVNDYMPGVYLLQIQSTESVFIRKFVKN